jgi:hypothetical protein
MSVRPDLGRRRISTIGGAAAAIAMLLIAAQPVRAECNPPGADPSFRKAAPYATRIVIGSVVAVEPDAVDPGDGTSYRFTLAVERTLRGTATPILIFSRLETGACVRWLSAATGDRLAMALDVHSSDPSVPTNMAGWLLGAPPESGAYEALTLLEVLDLAQGPKPPDTSTGPSPADSPAVAQLGGFAVFAVAIGVFLTFASRRSRPR